MVFGWDTLHSLTRRSIISKPYRNDQQASQSILGRSRTDLPKVEALVWTVRGGRLGWN